MPNGLVEIIYGPTFERYLIPQIEAGKVVKLIDLPVEVSEDKNSTVDLKIDCLTTSNAST